MNQIIETASEQREVTEEYCAGCDAPSEAWSDPITKDGQEYCCVNCCNGLTCTCVEVPPGEGPPQTA